MCIDLQITFMLVSLRSKHFNIFVSEDLDPDEVADFIATIMDSEFNTLVEDDSDLEVSPLESV